MLPKKQPFSLPLCQICLNKNNKLLRLCQCSHEFCQNCCNLYLDEKIQNFVQVLCPYPQCQQKLDKKSQFYQSLSPSVVEKLNKIEKFVRLQKNPHLKPCSSEQCQGLINLNKIKKTCSECQKPHCPKCLKQFHNGACILDHFDEQMRENKYQKCPTCQIWVDKKDGCQYIECKCGTAFCYFCGAQFSSDPCRMMSINVQNHQIKQLLNQLKYRLPQSCIGKILVPFKLILQLFLFTFLTVIGSLVVILTYFLKYLQSLTLIPYVTIHVLCTQLPYAARFFFIIFIPILVFSYFCMFTTLYAVYPLFRRYYHHGLYDGLEKILLKETICYLSMVKAIFSL